MTLNCAYTLSVSFRVVELRFSNPADLDMTSTTTALLNQKSKINSKCRNLTYFMIVNKHTQKVKITQYKVLAAFGLEQRHSSA